MTVTRGGAANRGLHDSYILSGTAAGIAMLHCRVCGEFPPLKSNAGIAEERVRLLRDLADRDEPVCPNPAYSNHSVPVGHDSTQYQ